MGNHKGRDGSHASSGFQTLVSLTRRRHRSKGDIAEELSIRWAERSNTAVDVNVCCRNGQLAQQFVCLGRFCGSICGRADEQGALSCCSFLGWEELDVVDPEAEKAGKGSDKPDAGLHQEVSTPLVQKDSWQLNTNERKRAWGTKQFQQYIGMDVTSLLSVPVWIMEPFTILQKAAEIMEYTDLLDKADQCENPHERCGCKAGTPRCQQWVQPPLPVFFGAAARCLHVCMYAWLPCHCLTRRFAWLAAYCVSPFGSAERAWKPFNPILGETFQVEVGNGVQYLAEQVSHHPPVCAAHAENKHFKYDLVSAPTTKFLGNSLEVYPYGRTRITLRSTGEVYTLVPPNAMVHNIVIGRTWVDAFGPLYIGCASTGAQCVLEFTPCGWFSYGRYEFSGWVQDKEGRKHIRLSGKWNQYCDMVPCDAEGVPLEGAESTRLWTCAPKPANDYYSFTHFAHLLNKSDNIRTPLPSDSRRRPDRAALAAGVSSTAGSEKYRLEEMQRAEKRERDRRNDKWQPLWFDPVDAPQLLPGELDVAKVPFWQFNGKFMQARLEGTSGADEVGQGGGAAGHDMRHKQQQRHVCTLWGEAAGQAGAGSLVGRQWQWAERWPCHSGGVALAGGRWGSVNGARSSVLAGVSDPARLLQRVSALAVACLNNRSFTCCVQRFGITTTATATLRTSTSARFTRPGAGPSIPPGKQREERRAEWKTQRRQ
ncbi:uncharacterized protein HaLaN_16828, partial [Haematococcus lacustris]